jgi:hypothetical protein
VNTMKRVSKPDDVPRGPHLAVFVYKTATIHVPGDERSRTHPGHGYPAHVETVANFEHWVTSDDEAGKRALETFLVGLATPAFPGMFHETPPYVVLRVASRCDVTTRTVVDLG